MKKLTAFFISLLKGITQTSIVSLSIILFLFGGIILNYFIEGKVHASVESHNKGTQLVVKHEQYKQIVDKTAFSLSQIDNELSKYLLTGNEEKLLTVKEQMAGMQQNLFVIKEEAKLYVPKYLVNIYIHKVRNRVDFQNSILTAYHQGGKDAALLIFNNAEYRHMYAEYARSETDLNLALNIKIEQLNKTMLNDEQVALQLDNRWNIISFVCMLFIAIVVLIQTIKINRLNRKLGFAVKKMKFATQVKDQFMSNITHELRTPLNSIIGYTNLLLKRKHEPETGKWIQAVNSSGNMLLDVVNDVLDYSKLESGYQHISYDEFQLDDVLSNLKNIMSNRAETKLLSFVVLKDQSLPDSFMGDEKKLKQILINLTGNAIKFSETGTVKVEVMLQKQMGDQYWLEFIVSDTGIGISAENLEYVFNRFYQVENNFSKKYSGTGLGLPIVKQLVDLQGGTITAKSEIGKGTVFTVVLPFEKIETSVKEAELNLAPVRTMLQSSKKKILVVDDHELNRDLLVLLLKEYNCNVITANNGYEALKLLRVKTFDLILMDVQMPEMNGLEATQKIRNLLVIDTPVIACTAFSQPKEKQACIDAGMNDYLGKPVNETELLKLLYKYLHLEVTEMNSTLLINYKQIQGITGHNKQLAANMISRAVEMIPEELEQLHQAILQKNAKLIKELAHNMCSTLGLMGAPTTLVEQMKKLQYSSAEQSSDFETTLYLFYQINDTVKKMIVELKNYIAA